MSRRSLTKMTETKSFEDRPEASEGKSSVPIWGKGIPGRGTSKCDGPEAGTGLACLENVVCP